MACRVLDESRTKPAGVEVIDHVENGLERGRRAGGNEDGLPAAGRVEVYDRGIR
jgi:hypothetical protein